MLAVLYGPLYFGKYGGSVRRMGLRFRQLGDSFHTSQGCPGCGLKWSLTVMCAAGVFVKLYVAVIRRKEMKPFLEKP